MSMNVSNQKAVMSEINVTPLVDVMLVLLVVFIVTAPLLTSQALHINLPKTQAVSQSDPKQSNQLVISADGILRYNSQEMNEVQLGKALKDLSNDPKAQLQIMADEAVPYGRVAKIMALSQASGVVKISFLTDAKVSK